ncbi:hypothetical protein COU77_01390 [Candidatus Peregrinibacteria bacterium CG10_big_fil_rev_8_21_14_0_10_49_16]|nr:MAG: hypothetical protein COW95_00320 [Candidatus Peregrinibacteria bacterium CG22_combo_CG10-13_8_21_14_all_49_11]PIR52243.1 MAG: hypothetical protein COU77_01390 [Candidatus Peregrinibacteria bacterium CG10_big_fil_rev_8_21_14_0_10_49_16]
MTTLSKALLLSSKPTADIVEGDITESAIHPIVRSMSDAELSQAKSKVQDRLTAAYRVAEDLLAMHQKLREIRDVLGYDPFRSVIELRKMEETLERYYNKYKDLHRREEELIKRLIDDEIKHRQSS